MENQYVAYYRVSTDRQGRSGLGLEAQQRAVEAFVQGRGEIIESFTEVESGRKVDRKALRAALALCKKRKARLVIAKLDRLARNVHFVSGLMEANVDFVAVDMPEANRLTIHILAAVAEHERDMTSIRTKEALASAKARGTKLGNPRPEESLRRGRATVAEHRRHHRELVRSTIDELRQSMGFQAIARELNSRGVKSVTGRQWYAQTVANFIRDNLQT